MENQTDSELMLAVLSCDNCVERALLFWNKGWKRKAIEELRRADISDYEVGSQYDSQGRLLAAFQTLHEAYSMHCDAFYD